MSELNRLEVVEQVVSCTNCELHTVGSGPVAFSGPKENPNGIAILGEAPGRQEDAAGEPFVGPAGELLRKHLTEVGITPERCFIINTVSCWPNGTPKPEHVMACSANKAAQLAIARPKWLLLLGKVAMNSVRPGLKLANARGRPFATLGGPIHFVTYHPAAALRKGAYEVAMRDDLEKFMEVCLAGESWHRYIVYQCWECADEEIVWFDPPGMSWCERHAPLEYHNRIDFLKRDYQEACARLEKARLG